MACQILIIDDSPTIQKVIKIAFAKFPITTQSAATIEEALKITALKPPQLLVIDASMAENKSMPTLKALADQAEAKILLLIGSYESVNEKGLDQLGIPYRLRKPFAAQDMVQCVQKILGDKFPHTTDSKSPPVGLPPLPEQKDFTGHPIEELLHEDLLRSAPTATSSPFAGVPPPPGKHAVEGLPPLPSVVPKRKGQKAFQDGDEVTSKVSAPDLKGDEIRGVIKEIIQAEQFALVKDLVSRYCEQHFPAVAREILTVELNRLARERAQILSEDV